MLARLGIARLQVQTPLQACGVKCQSSAGASRLSLCPWAPPLAALASSARRFGHRHSAISRSAGKKARTAQSLQVQERWRCFEGTLFHCSYRSQALGGLRSSFSVYIPDAPRMQMVLPYPDDCEEFPVVMYLSDMGRSHMEVVKESTALEHSAACGLIFLAADTSPRGEGVPDEPRVDVGIGASFYVNATEKPWAEHYRMQDYLEELLDLVHKNFPTCGPEEVSLMGHAMGGLGALATAIRRPKSFRSVSVLTPIAHPTAIPELSEKSVPDVRAALSAYLGSEEAWRKYDPTCLIEDCSTKNASQLPPILLDVGSETLQSHGEVYRPLEFVNTCSMRGVPVELRVRAGFDHSHFFVTSVMEEHLDFHSKHLDAV